MTQAAIVALCNHELRPLEVFETQVDEFHVSISCAKCGAELEVVAV